MYVINKGKLTFSKCIDFKSHDKKKCAQFRLDKERDEEKKFLVEKEAEEKRKAD
jgi:hypothetical protein